MVNNLPRKLTSHVCPMCNERTLEAQCEVVWCSNLNAASNKPCQFGLGTGEKTINDLAA